MRHPTSANFVPFTVRGEVRPLNKAGARMLRPDEVRALVSTPDVLAQRTRPLGGWLMTYGKIGLNNVVIPTLDRDRQIAEYAAEFGRVDFGGYDRWNDTHRKSVIVGLPAPGRLEFHDVTSPLAQAHRKVGYWTEGWLFDRNDPGSWAGLRDENGMPRMPTAHEFARADHFWHLALELEHSPRKLGFSADGIVVVSRDGTRMLYAVVNAAAVCELPVNPDSTAEILGPVEALAKARASYTAPLVPEDLEGVSDDEEGVTTDPSAAWNYAVQRIMELYAVEQSRAEAWLRRYVLRRRGSPTANTPPGDSDG